MLLGRGAELLPRFEKMTCPGDETKVNERTVLKVEVLKNVVDMAK